MLSIFAFIVTVVVGLFATAIFGSWINWPEAGAVFAVATMGAFILWTLREKKRGDDDQEDSQA